MHEDIFAILTGDEAEALVGVEPLHCTGCHKQSPPSVATSGHLVSDGLPAGSPARELLEAKT
jgi:hypothetical protein